MIQILYDQFGDSPQTVLKNSMHASTRYMYNDKLEKVF